MNFMPFPGLVPEMNLCYETYPRFSMHADVPGQRARMFFGFEIKIEHHNFMRMAGVMTNMAECLVISLFPRRSEA